MLRNARNRFNALRGACRLFKRVQSLWQAPTARPVWPGLHLFALLGTLLLVQNVFAQGRPDIAWMRGGHTSFVRSVAFSPDSRLLASGSSDGTVKFWRVADGALLRTYDQETGPIVLSIQFSPNGRLFGYGRLDATVVVARNPFSN
jgi:WD40 repeat protein